MEEHSNLLTSLEGERAPLTVRWKSASSAEDVAPQRRYAMSIWGRAKKPLSSRRAGLHCLDTLGSVGTGMEAISRRSAFIAGDGGGDPAYGVGSGGLRPPASAEASPALPAKTQPVLPGAHEDRDHSLVHKSLLAAHISTASRYCVRDRSPPAVLGLFLAADQKRVAHSHHIAPHPSLLL